MNLTTGCLIVANEQNARELFVTVCPQYADKNVSLSFVTPKRQKRSTAPLVIDADGHGVYTLTAEVLDGAGTLAAQIDISNGDGTFVKKSSVFIFTVGRDLSEQYAVVGGSTYTIADIIAMFGDVVSLPADGIPADYVPTSDGEGGYSWEASATGDDVVKYTAQTKTDEEKAQARANIGAVDETDIAEAVSGLASETFVATEVGNLDNSLAAVAKSGSYSDLEDTPEIPSIEGLASETYVDSAVAGLASETYVDEAVSGLASETYVDSAVAVKQDSINDSNKLDADFVDDSDSVNKFVTAADKTTWNAKQNAYISRSVMLDADGWINNEQTVTAMGVTASNLVQVAPIPNDVEAYAAAKIICTGQATDSLTFVCGAEPEDDLTVNVVIWG